MDNEVEKTVKNECSEMLSHKPSLRILLRKKENGLPFRTIHHRAIKLLSDNEELWKNYDYDIRKIPSYHYPPSSSPGNSEI